MQFGNLLFRAQLATSELRHALRKAWRSKAAEARKSAVEIIALEDRLLLSASPMAVPAPDSAESAPTEQVRTDQIAATDSSGSQKASADSVSPQAATSSTAVESTSEQAAFHELAASQTEQQLVDPGVEAAPHEELYSDLMGSPSQSTTDGPVAGNSLESPADDTLQGTSSEHPDAAPMPGAAQQTSTDVPATIDSQTAPSQHADDSDHTGSIGSGLVLVSAPQPATHRTEVAFVDSQVDNYQQIVADLQSQSTSDRQIEVIVLDSGHDGIEQITDTLRGRHDIDAIHVFSHGTAGAVKMGDVWLTQDLVANYQGEFQSWQAALSTDADILLYGCEVAASAGGVQLLGTLSQLTSADVSASSNNTGSALFGGDWNLEYSTGSIETAVAVSDTVQQNWTNLLNVAVDSASSVAIDGVLSTTLSHTTSGSNRLMLVSIAIDPHGSIGSSVTYNGVALTRIGVGSQVGTHSRMEFWELLSPTPGTHNVVVNLTGSSYHGAVIGVMTFTGVDQSNPVQHFATTNGDSSFGSATIASQTGDLVFGVVHAHHGTTSTPGAGQTEYWDDVGDISYGGGTVTAGAASVTNSWTLDGDDWTVAMISVHSDTSGPAISGLEGDLLRYTAGGGPIVIERGSDTTITDIDSPNFNTGTLTVSLASGSDSAEDILNVRNQGTDAGQIGVSGTNVTYGGTIIGTLTGGSDGVDLVITLNTNADEISTAALIENITYRNSDLSNPTLGARTVSMVLTDGDGGTSAIYDTTVSLGPPTQDSGLWLSSVTNATSSSGVSWTDGTVVNLSDPGLAFEPGTTSGTFSPVFDIDTFAGDGNAKVRGLSLVHSTTTIGTGGGSVTLQNGDILFTTEDNESFGGVVGTNKDVWLFRPTTPGDESTGTFSILINSPTASKIRDISLVESTITVGGYTLNAGDLLMTQEGSAYDKNVWLFRATSVGDGTTAGTFAGTSFGFTQQIGAFEFVNQTMTLGDVTLQAGQLVLSVLGNDTVGDNNLPVTKFDLFVLDVIQAGSTTTSTASLLLQGSDVGISAGGEEWDALTIVVSNHAPALSGANNFTTITEDPVSNPGTLLSTIVSGHVTDSDAGAMGGVAVTALDNTNGMWQWSANGGYDWSNFGTPSSTAARLLIADSNTYVRFVPNANWNGTVTNGFTFRAWDQTGGTAGLTADASLNGNSTPFSSNTASSSITVTGVNDAPTATIVPASYSVNEQTTLTLQGTGLSIADVDAASGTVQATVSVVSGTLTASAGTTGVSVAGNGTNSITLSGTITQINNLLAGNLTATLTYINSSNTPAASDTLTLSVSDLGNTGAGGVLTGSDTATIAVTAVNDAPTATIAPASYAVNEQTTLTLHGQGLSIADVDAGPGTVQTTVSVVSGTLTATAGTTGVSVSGSGTNSITLSGTITQINNLLAGSLSATLTYFNSSDAPVASDTLTLLVSDLGNTGSGGAQTGNDTAVITITAVNDAPTATIVPASYSVNEQTTLALQGTGMSIADVDAGSGTVQVTVSVVSGALTAAAGTTGVLVSGSGTSSVTLSGTVGQVNILLAGNLAATLTYFNSSDTPAANDTLTLSVSDLGNTGSGGTLTASDSATITLVAVNDGPTATIVPASYSANEQTILTLHGTGLSIADVDAGAGTVQTTVSVVSGTLTAAAGTSGVSVSGSGTSTVTLTGTVSQINALLAGNLSGTLTYLNSSDTPAASDTLTLAVSDLGNTGTGGVLTGSDMASITITAVNDAPTATIVPASYSLSEQATLILHGTGLSIADVDAGSGTVQATVSVIAGTLTAAAGTTGVSVSGSGTNSITLSGTLSQINNLLAGNLSATLTYVDNSNTPGASDTLTLAVSDLGNTGTGGASTASDSATITVSSVNDAPTATIVPVSYAVNEQTTLTLHGTGISIADVDAGSGTVQATVSVISGTLTASAGTSGVSVSGSGTSTITLSGSISQINDLLAGNLAATLTYFNGSNTPAASDTLTLNVNDLGNTGSGGALTGSDSATITLTAVNDAPTAIIVPASYAVNEQTTLALHGTGLSIADVDAGSGTVQATVSVVSGTLTAAAGTTGVAMSGSGTSTITLSGTITQINNLLTGNLSASLTYFNSSDTPAASDTLTLTVSDLGNTGSGGSLTGSDTAVIAVTAINDAPTATIVPASYSVNEQTTLTLQGTGLSITDVDAASGAVQATVSVVSGTLTASAGTTGVSVAGNGTNSITLSGTISQINNLLAGNLTATLTYINSSNTPATSDTLTLAVSDLGNTGSGGILTGSDTASIVLASVNDAPTATISLPGYSVNEQTTLTLHGTGFSIADVDAGSGTVQATVSVVSGALTATAGTTGVVVSGSGTSTITLSGTISQINDVLAGNLAATLTYFNSSNTPAASDTLTLMVSDLGNTGSGGALTASDTATITVVAVNDAPTATISLPSYSVNEQTSLTLHGTGLSIADVDAASGTVQATVSVVSGTLTALAGTTGVSVTGSGTNSITLSGTVSQINNLLAGSLSATLTYINGSDTPAATDTLTLAISDLGNTGTGGVLTSSDSATIAVTAVNDAPTATIVPVSYAVNEQTILVLHGTGLSIADIDAGAGIVQATVTVVSGSLTASAGTTGVSVSGSGTSTITLSGTVSQINNLLGGSFAATLTYINGSDTPAASDTLTLAISDLGNTGSGGTLTASDSAIITVSAVNDAPTATIVPASYSVNEQTALALQGTGLSIVDVDATSSTVQATVSVVSGTLTAAAGTTGVSVSGSGTSSITLSGTVSQINNLLAGNLTATLTYINSSNTPAASDTLTLAVSDLGNTGVGGTLTSSDSATIAVTAVNDAPTATIVPTSYAVNEQTTLTLHGTGLSIADVDAGSGTVQATVSVVSGTLTATAGTTGVSVSGSGTNAVTLSGTITQINNLLAGGLSATLTYFNGSDTPAASDTLTLSVSDLGNTGSGGAQTGSDSATITLTAVNDAPTATMTPAGYSVNEQTTLTLHGTGLSIADVDAGSGAVQALLSVAEGTLSASAGSTGAVVTGNGTNTITLSGTVSQINSLLAGNLSATLTYINNSDTPVAADTLTLAVSDQGNTGVGGPLTASDSATITVAAVNDAPSATIISANYAVNEQTTLVLQGTGLSIADIDVGSGTVQATLSVVAGTLTASAGTTGVSVSGTGTNTITLSGTLSQINDLLAGNLAATLTYFNGSDTPAATDTLTLEVSDLGNTGLGGALIASDFATINVAAVNDAPTAVIAAGNFVVDEQTTLILHGTGLNIADLDAGSGTVQATLSVISGTLTAEAGTTGVTISGNGTNAVTLSGIVGQINELLAGNLSGTLTYFIDSDTPPPTDTLTLLVSDLHNTGLGGTLTDTDSAVITLNALNDAPVILSNQLTVTEGQTTVVTASNLNATDSDNPRQDLTYTVSNVTHGYFEVVGAEGVSITTFTQLDIDAGRILFVHDGGEVAPTYSVAVTDGNSLVRPAAATITFTDVNDAPVATVDQYTTNQYASLDIPVDTGVLSNDTDVDNTQLTAEVIQQPEHGTVRMNADGSFEYIPDKIFLGRDTFTYVAFDGSATSAVVTVDITVTQGGNGVTTSEDPINTGNHLPSIVTPNPGTPISNNNGHVPILSTPSNTLLDDDYLITGTSPGFKSPRLASIESAGDVYGEDDLLIYLNEEKPLNRTARLTTSKTAATSEVRTVRNDELQDNLDSFQEELERGAKDQQLTDQFVAGAATLVTGVFSVGYVIWILRSGTLVATMLSLAPSWIALDPLPILDSLGDPGRKANDADQSDDSLLSLVASRMSKSSVDSEPERRPPAET
ncbi:MAG: hypothetical protein JWN70_936 [Planctomycetaceae bacterium]|nr:hypothetical protein [Planctomycetaceae bacterium]